MIRKFFGWYWRRSLKRWMIVYTDVGVDRGELLKTAVNLDLAGDRSGAERARRMAEYAVDLQLDAKAAADNAAKKLRAMSFAVPPLPWEGPWV